jgi:hypothetical protein
VPIASKIEIRHIVLSWCFPAIVRSVRSIRSVGVLENTSSVVPYYVYYMIIKIGIDEKIKFDY